MRLPSFIHASCFLMLPPTGIGADVLPCDVPFLCLEKFEKKPVSGLKFRH
jgi:hypothetical protein